MRKELKISIPVQKEHSTVGSFVSQEGDFRYWNVHGSVIDFIKKSLTEFGISENHFSFSYFQELIKNSYDSYAGNGLRPGEMLEIKIVVNNKTDDHGKNITVKIKDNGPGFSDQKKGTPFSRDKVKQVTKPEGSLGGSCRGLNNFVLNQENRGVSVFFKNRKQGASVYLDIPKERSCFRNVPK